MNSLKRSALEACLLLIQEKLDTLSAEISRVEAGKKDETKSTSGDKHEVGRAMAQNEVDRLKSQLSEQLRMKHLLSAMPTGGMDMVGNGSYVQTNNGDFFIGVPLGKVMHNNRFCYALSAASPMGQQLMGKIVGEQVTMNGVVFKIESVD